MQQKLMTALDRAVPVARLQLLPENGRTNLNNRERSPIEDLASQIVCQLTCTCGDKPQWQDKPATITADLKTYPYASGEVDDASHR